MKYRDRDRMYRLCYVDDNYSRREECYFHQWATCSSNHEVRGIVETKSGCIKVVYFQQIKFKIEEDNEDD